MWLFTIELAFRKRYNIPRAQLSESSLNHSIHSRYTSIVEMVDLDLRSIVEVRNKLAHGQWRYPLNSDNNDVSQEHMDSLRKENILSLQYKKQLINHLSNIIHDLVVSKPTFERDFDRHYMFIVNTRMNLKSRDYNDYKEKLIEKYEKGKLMRAP